MTTVSPSPESAVAAGSGPTASIDSERHSKSFRTYAAYLRAFRQLALGTEPLDTALPQLAQRAVLEVKSGKPGGGADKAIIRGCLNRAWGTELILCTTAALAEETEVIRLANSWAVVQAYYAVYGATQAVLVSEGDPRPTDHEATRKAFVNLWVTRSIDLAPWTFSLGFPDNRTTSSAGYRGGPTRALEDQQSALHPWSRWGGDQCWDVAAQALKNARSRHVSERTAAERRRRHTDRRKAFQAEQNARADAHKRPLKQPSWWDRTAQLTAQDKIDVERKVRPTTVMDHLFRLRIRANYEDAAMFTEGPETDKQASAWSHNLVDFTAATMLVHELRVAYLLGADFLIAAADDWISRNRSAVTGGVAYRRPVLTGHV